jgi:hypothetical protein
MHSDRPRAWPQLPRRRPPAIDPPPFAVMVARPDGLRTV